MYIGGHPNTIVGASASLHFLHLDPNLQCRLQHLNWYVHDFNKQAVRSRGNRAMP